MICKTTQDLNNHTSKIEAQDIMDSEIEALASKYFDDLKSGKFILTNSKQHHIEDFIDDLDIDPDLLSQCLNGNHLSLELFLIEALNDHCFELAKEELK